MTQDVEKLSEELGFPVPEIELVRLHEIHFDPRVQRPEDPRKLAEMTANWEPAGINVLSLSRRPDGSLICLDGQHRTKAGIANGFNEETWANVWQGLTLKQEAILFRLLNNTTKVGILAAFPIMVAAEDPTAVAIQHVLDRRGIKVGTPDGLFAVGAALRIANKHKGIEALDWSIGVISDTWGANKTNLDGRLLEALAIFHLHYGPLVDVENLRTKLSGVASGVHGLLGKARTVRELKGGRLQVALVEVLVGLYNSNKRRNVLPEWVR